MRNKSIMRNFTEIYRTCQPELQIQNTLEGGGGGWGPTTSKIMPPGKTQMSFFLFFFETFNIDVLVSSKVNKKKVMSFVFFIFLWSFLFILPDLVNDMSSSREQKRSYRWDNHTMSFVLFVVKPTPPPPHILIHTASC